MLFGHGSFFFEVMVYVGLGLPLVNLLLGALGLSGHGGGDVSADLSADVAVDSSFDLDTGVDGLDLDSGDAGDMASDGASPGKGVPLAFDVYCLCFAFVTCGAIGVFAMQKLSGFIQIATVAGGFALGVLGYVALYRFLIFPLKKNNAEALKAGNLRFRHAIVTFRITKDSPGTIETKDAVGAYISYRAELDPEICKEERIEEGEEVIITEIDKENGYCHVALAQRKTLR